MKRRLNRFDPKVKRGTDITISDGMRARCYYVAEVIDPKTIKVKPYIICADKEKTKGIKHQEWRYFKTVEAATAYLGEDYDGHEPEEQTWHIDQHNIKIKTETGYRPLMDGLCKGRGYITFGTLSYDYDTED